MKKVLNYAGWLKYNSDPWPKYSGDQHKYDEWWCNMKHVPCSDEYKKSRYYPYHPAAYEYKDKRWCIHTYYCLDLLLHNKVARKNYFDLVRFVDVASFDGMKKVMI